MQAIWKAHGLSPHRWRSCKLSNDPAFAEKVTEIVALYVDPPAHAVVLSFDEKSQIQALDRTHPGQPMKKGRAGTMTHDYKQPRRQHEPQRAGRITSSMAPISRRPSAAFWGVHYTIEGTRPGRTAALLSAGADIRITPRFSFGMRAYSELSGTTESFGGTAVIKGRFYLGSLATTRTPCRHPRQGVLFQLSAERTESALIKRLNCRHLGRKPTSGKR